MACFRPLAPMGIGRPQILIGPRHVPSQPVGYSGPNYYRQHRHHIVIIANFTCLSFHRSYGAVIIEKLQTACSIQIMLITCTLSYVVDC